MDGRVDIVGGWIALGGKWVGDYDDMNEEVYGIRSELTIVSPAWIDRA